MEFTIHMLVKCSHEYQVPHAIPCHTKRMSTKKWLWLNWLHFAERWFKFCREYGYTHYCVCPGVCWDRTQSRTPALWPNDHANLGCYPRDCVLEEYQMFLTFPARDEIEKGIILISKSLRSYHWAPINITLPDRYNNSPTINILFSAVLMKIPTLFTK